MINARLKLAGMMAKQKPANAKGAMKKVVDVPLSTEMIDWLDDTIHARDDDGFGSEAVTSILAQPLDTESVYCPVSSIISSKLAAPRVPSPPRSNKHLQLANGASSSTFSASSILGHIKGSSTAESSNESNSIVPSSSAMVAASSSSSSSSSGHGGSNVQEAVDRMNFLWLQRRATFEREEGKVGKAIDTLNEALQVHLGNEDYTKARLADRVVGGTGEELFKHIQKECFLYDQSAHRIASKLQNFYHKHHMKRGAYATLISKTFRMYLAYRTLRRYKDLRRQCAQLIQFRFRVHLAKMNRLAARIQNWWRIRSCVWEYHRLLHIYRMARRIQRLWRGLKGRIRAYWKAMELYSCKKIQRLARAYIFRRDRGFYLALYHKLYYRAAVRIQCLGRRIQAIKRAKNQLLFEIAREDGRLLREKAMIAETIQIEIRRTRMYLATNAGKLHFQDTMASIRARDEYFQHIEPQLTIPEKLARSALVAFELLDDDGAGNITEAKLSLLLKELCIPMKPETLHHLFGDMDKFKTGEIDFNEFLDWYCNSNGGMVDSNGDATEDMAMRRSMRNTASAKEMKEQEEQAQKRSLKGRLKSTARLASELFMRLQKGAKDASGSTLAKRAERQILRQSTHWLTRDAIAAFRTTCNPKFQCCQCLKPFVLFTDYFLHFNQTTGHCQVFEEKALFYKRYWMKHAWNKQRQCEYEIISLNNEYPKIEHYKTIAIYNELALQQEKAYASILKKYEKVAQRMYMHILDPTYEDLALARMSKRKEEAKEKAQQAADAKSGVGTSATGTVAASSRRASFFGSLLGGPKDLAAANYAKDAKGSKKGGKSSKKESKKDGKKKKKKGAADESDSAAEEKKEGEEEQEKAAAEGGNDAAAPGAEGENSQLPSGGDPTVVVPLPPSMRELILKISDADLLVDTEMSSPHVMQCIAQHLRCNIPIGWIASNKYPLTEVLEWLVEEVDERVALEKPCWVLTAAGKLKRDAMVIGKIHVYGNRIYQVAMEEALVTLLNNRLMRPRRMTIPDEELIEIGLPSLTTRSYCDFSIRIVRKLDRINRSMYKLYTPKPKSNLLPLASDTTNTTIRQLLSRSSVASFGAFSNAMGIVATKLGLPFKNSLILCKRFFTYIFGSYLMYAKIGILGGGDDDVITPEVIKEYMLEENHARAYAKLSFRFRTLIGKDQLKRLANELWAMKRIDRDKYKKGLQKFQKKQQSATNNNPGSSSADEDERAVVDLFSAEYISDLLEYTNNPQKEKDKYLIVALMKKLLWRETTLAEAVEKVAALKYMYELVATEFAPPSRPGMDLVDLDIVCQKLSLKVPESKKHEVKPVLDPRNINKVEFPTLAHWLYNINSGITNGFWVYLKYLAISRLMSNRVKNLMLSLTQTRYKDDAKLKLVCNQRILSRLEGDLRQLLIVRMHDDDYILNMGKYAPSKGPIAKQVSASKEQNDNMEAEITGELEPLPGNLEAIDESGEANENVDMVNPSSAEAPADTVVAAAAASAAATAVSPDYAGHAGSDELPNSDAVVAAEQSASATAIEAKEDGGKDGDAASTAEAKEAGDSDPKGEEVAGAVEAPFSNVGYAAGDGGEDSSAPADGSVPQEEKGAAADGNDENLAAGEAAMQEEGATDPYGKLETMSPTALLSIDDADDYLMKRQIDLMKDDDEQGELRVLYRQAEDKAEKEFKLNVRRGKRTYQVMTEALLIKASYDMMKTYSCCISTNSTAPHMPFLSQVAGRKFRNGLRRVRNGFRALLSCGGCMGSGDTADLHLHRYSNRLDRGYEMEEDPEPHEVGWDLTLAILIYTFDTDCTGNFDEGEIRLLLECCRRTLSEKEILYHFPEVRLSSSTSELITAYLAPRVSWKVPRTGVSGALHRVLTCWNKRTDRGVISVNTKNVYSTAMMSLISLNRQMALESAKTATLLAKNGKLTEEDDDEKDSGCLVTRCQLLAMRQVTLFMRTYFGTFHRIILQHDDIEVWWKSCVINSKFAKMGVISYACYVFSEEHSRPRVLITEIPYILRFLMERFNMIRWGDMSKVAAMVMEAMKLTYKLVYLPIEQIARLIEPMVRFRIPESAKVRFGLWKMRKSAAKLREQDTFCRIMSMARGQAIQIALNFPNLYVPHTNYRCCILGVMKIWNDPAKMKKKKSRKNAEEGKGDDGKPLAMSHQLSHHTNHSKPAPQHSAAVTVGKQPGGGYVLLKETAMLYLLSYGYTMADMRFPEVRQVIVAEHPNGSLSTDTIDKDRLIFWGRRNEGMNLSIAERADRWRRFLIYSVFWSAQYTKYKTIILEHKGEADVIAANYLKEIMTGVSHCANEEDS